MSLIIYFSNLIDLQGGYTMEIILAFSVLLNLVLLWLCHTFGKQCDDLVDDCFDLMAEVCKLRLKVKGLENK